MQVKLSNKIIVLTIVVTFIALSSAYAQPPERRGWKENKARREAFRKELSEKLNLTPEQQKLLDANRSEHRQKMKEIFKNIGAKRSELREELQKPTLDLEKVKSRQTELKTLYSSMLDLRLEGILKANEILTPEQRRIMVEFFEEKREKFPPFGNRERMDIPSPPFDDMDGRDILPLSGGMRGVCFPPLPPFAMMEMCVPPPPRGALRGMDVSPLPSNVMERLDDME